MPGVPALANLSDLCYVQKSDRTNLGGCAVLVTHAVTLPAAFASFFAALNEMTNQECTARCEMEGYRLLTRPIVW